MYPIDALLHTLALIGGISLALCAMGLIGEAIARLDAPAPAARRHRHP